MRACGDCSVSGAGRLVRKGLAHPRLPPALAVLAVLVTLPCIRQGLLADDLIHRTLFLTSPLSSAIRDMFVFADPARNREWMDVGTMPWWTADGLRIAFFRPLSVLTHWVDYKLWPDSVTLMHVQNVLWYAGVCLVATAVYRRLIDSGWVAGLAALLFTMDVVHLGSVAWVANRNVLLAVLFGLLCLRSHDRWRREGRRGAVVAGCLWLTASVFSAEAAVAMGAYLTAYAVFLDRGPWIRRLVSLLPYATVGIVWQILYRLLGYGIQGSGFYVEPASEPLAFLQSFAERAPVLLLAQGLGILPFGYNFLSGPASHVVWIAASALALLIGFMFVPLLRANRVARFWAAGMLLAVVPACSIRLLSGRLLLFAGLGAMGLIALFVAGWFERSPWLPARGVRRFSSGALCYLLLALHVALPPLIIPAMAALPRRQQETIERLVDIGSLRRATQGDVIVVNAPSPFHFMYLRDLRRFRGEPLPGRIRVLAEGYGSVDITREDDRTLVLRPDLGYVPRAGLGVGDPQAPPPFHLAHMYQHLGTFFRRSSHPAQPGDRVALTGVAMEITALSDDGRPGEIRVQFEQPFEHPSRTWLRWDWEEERYEEFTLPAVGETVRVPGAEP